MSEEEEELEVVKVVSNLARGDNWRSNHTEELRKPPMKWTLVEPEPDRIWIPDRSQITGSVCPIRLNIQIKIQISGFKTGSGPGLSRIQLDPAKPDPDLIPVQKTWSWIRSGSTPGCHMLRYPWSGV